MVPKKSMRTARYAYNVDAYIAGSLYGLSERYNLIDYTLAIYGKLNLL
jgi:hypothetical protein